MRKALATKDFLMQNLGAAVPVIHERDPYKNSKSLEVGFRARRFEEIRSIIQAILDEKGHAEILDLGGS